MSNAWKPLGGILTNICLISLLDLRLLLDRLLLIPLCLSLNPSLLGLNQKIVRLSNVIEAPSVLCTVKCIVAVSNCSHLYFVIGKLSCHHLSRVLSSWNHLEWTAKTRYHGLPNTPSRTLRSRSFRGVRQVPLVSCKMSGGGVVDIHAGVGRGSYPGSSRRLKV
jgi:hypothetical protein